jgi:hypothetical protein
LHITVIDNDKLPLWFRQWPISLLKQNIRSLGISLKNMEKPLPNAYIERVMDPRAQGRWN